MFYDIAIDVSPYMQALQAHKMGTRLNSGLPGLCLLFPLGKLSLLHILF